MADIDIPASDKELLAQCDVQVFRSTGPGGQSVNTTDSAVRLRHRPTGVTVVCRRERSQHLNKQECLRRLRTRLERLAYRPPERVTTAPSKAARERRLREKALRGEAKRLREPPADEG